MVKTFVSDRPDQALDISVLPGRAERGGPIPDAHRSHAGLECGAKCSVIVANKIFRCAVPRKRFGDLAREPLCRCVSGHRNPQQLPPSVAENKKREQLLKGNRREPQRDQSTQSPPYDCKGRSSTSAMADRAAAPFRSKPWTGRPRCRA